MTPTIQIMQPQWRGSDREDRLAAFWSEIDTSPTYVVMVAVYDGSTWGLGGIFSTRDLAMEWAASRHAPCVVQARRLDDPDWGRVDVQ